MPTFSFLKKIKYKSGGTFFKFFPFLFTDQLLKQAAKNGIIPIVYIHPYEFENGKNFRIAFKLTSVNSYYYPCLSEKLNFSENLELPPFLD